MLKGHWRSIVMLCSRSSIVMLRTFYPRTLVEKVEILFIVQKETSQDKICFRSISFWRRWQTLIDYISLNHCQVSKGNSKRRFIKLYGFLQWTMLVICVCQFYLFGFLPKVLETIKLIFSGKFCTLMYLNKWIKKT